MGNPGELKTSERRMDAADKAREALNARIAGASYDAIAAKLGYASKSGAAMAVSRALKKTLAEPADELRTIHFWRLERTWQALMPKILAGDPAAVRSGVRVLEREAKLFGLDAPVKVDLRHLVDDVAKRHGLAPDESDALFAELSGYLADARSPVG